MQVNYITLDSLCSSSGIYNFSKNVNIEKCEKYIINIFTTGRYILKINGKYICEGPCKSHAHIRYYDCIETDAFVKGKNTIDIIVMHLFNTNRFPTVYHTPKPEVIFEAKSESNRIVSDTTWKCSYDERYTLLMDDDCVFFTPPTEQVDFRKKPVPADLCIADGFNNPAAFDFDIGETYSRYGIPEAKQLSSRTIPMIYPQEEISFTVVKHGKDFIELDAGKYVTAKLLFEFSKNTAAKIIYAECYVGKNGKGLRDDSTGEIKGIFDMVFTADKDEKYNPFWFRAFRFIRIEAENINQSLNSVKAWFCHYPFDIQSEFVCSDKYLIKCISALYHMVRKPR